MLRTESLAVRYGRLTALKELSTVFDVGVTALLGPNGAGKTSLLQALSTSNPSTSGELLFQGKSLDKPAAIRQYRRRLSFVPQDTSVAKHLRVIDFLSYVAWMKEVPTSQIGAAATAALKTVDLQDRSDTRLGQLSGGMQRRALFAQALVNDPLVLILDEPTAGLDPEQRTSLRSVIAAQGRDRVVVISTHLADDVVLTSERVIVLDEGSVLFDGTPSDLGALGEADNFATSLEAGYLKVIRAGGKP